MVSIRIKYVPAAITAALLLFSTIASFSINFGMLLNSNSHTILNYAQPENGSGKAGVVGGAQI